MNNPHICYSVSQGVPSGTGDAWKSLLLVTHTQPQEVVTKAGAQAQEPRSAAGRISKAEEDKNPQFGHQEGGSPESTTIPNSGTGEGGFSQKKIFHNCGTSLTLPVRR
mmetsp:Transcript_45340/g.74031  ORF Transcript_45340/g.74031 Transcript_45340/m.74031 type:complete len:108 (-) Transcript_45340:154-477(-)|eukprot:CAMPEP_0174347134 /NCGR_PEP_ID=MMETSP0811_2-20130205/3077_1 /TAXON_ID=73025 ORGANISM="Eutreptiella gymnastica-like, Strain CCMP1594" /NCGR_SAMPLE_ID=MMETSP0811_2 /ASSEMBLY_ACC=CAM_ASM_000667 /LENGTH=107 /DNA_ID=CAMNT_0015472349 /DNA_START=1295 /DNA_END=1618 /DNA_ORIENTATION=-